MWWMPAHCVQFVQRYKGTAKRYTGGGEAHGFGGGGEMRKKEQKTKTETREGVINRFDLQKGKEKGKRKEREINEESKLKK